MRLGPCVTTCSWRRLSSPPDRLLGKGSVPALLTGVLVPALVAITVNVWWNYRHERLKSEREYATKLVTDLREELRRAGALGVALWSKPGVETTRREMDQLVAAQSEMQALFELVADALKRVAESKVLESHIDDLADALTGGDFFSPDRTRALERCGRIELLTAAARNELAQRRHEQLVGGRRLTWRGTLLRLRSVRAGPSRGQSSFRREGRVT